MGVNIFVKTDALPREEWLHCRKRGIGGSDVAAILGISKWKSAVDLWLDKTNQSNELEEENEAMQWGNIMEPVIRNHFAEVMGKSVVQVKAILQHSEYPYLLPDTGAALSLCDRSSKSICGCHYRRQFVPCL